MSWVNMRVNIMLWILFDSRIKHEVRAAPVNTRSTNQERNVPMEVDAPAPAFIQVSAAPKVNTPPVRPVPKAFSPPEVTMSGVEQTKVDTTVSFNHPEKR